MSEVAQLAAKNKCQQEQLATVVSSFHGLFKTQFRTILLCIGDEPLYQPANTASDFHCIYFANQSWNSALHEIAHWCVAGPKRRQEIDYGYWYCPDGRNAAEQALFEKVEVRPQALEWLFTSAFRADFYASLDNLSAPSEDSQHFRSALRDEALSLLEKGLSHRASCFLEELIRVNGSRSYFANYWSKVELEGCLPL